MQSCIAKEGLMKSLLATQFRQQPAQQHPNTRTLSKYLILLPNDSPWHPDAGDGPVEECEVQHNDPRINECSD